MKRTYLICLFLCLTSTLLFSQSNPASSVSAKADPKAQAKILDQYGKLPLSFEANHGQTDSRVKFLSRTGGYSLFLTGDEAVLALSGKNASSNKAKIARTAHTLPSSVAASKAGGVLRMKLRNANPAAKVTGVDELAGTSNYFIGNDPAKWRTNVPTYAKVKYEGIYSGIDLVYYGNQRQLEYDFIVAPGADPHRIAFDVRGANRIRRDAHGDLVLKTAEGEIRWHKPVAYQEKNGTRQEIAAHYAITDTNRVAFELAKYDISRPLYIDPLIYSTYLGGSGWDEGLGIAVDSAGNAYVTGETCSSNFPTMNPFQPAYAGGCPASGYDIGGGDAFVTKINPSGSALIYSTYLGGSGDDGGNSIAVDSAGDAYVTGLTTSTNFPTTTNAAQPANGGSYDAFVTQLNPSGSALIYSTYLGGSGDDGGNSIAVDSAGNAYVTGWTGSTDFPTMNPFQSALGYVYATNAFVTKLNPTGSALVYSTYLGGSTFDYGTGIAVDSADNAYVTGYTYSHNFPTMNPLQAANGFEVNAFVTKFDPTGSALVYSTYLGGKGTSYDGNGGIAVDSAGNAYVTGLTDSTSFPTTANAVQPADAGGGDAFVSKLNPTGSALVYSTYLGGSNLDEGFAIAVDSAGDAYVTGWTVSNDFPTTTDAEQPAASGDSDAFVTKLDPTGSALLYSSYLGGGNKNAIGCGIAVGSAGEAYVTGYTDSINFPTMNPLQAVYGGGSYDAFVAKTSVPVETPTTTTLSSSPNPSTYGQAVTFTAVVRSSIGAPPDGETVTFREGTAVLGTAALSGGSASFTTSTLPGGSDSITAVYGGDSNFLGSKSKALSQVVSQATSTTTLVSSPNPSGFGQSVKFTATVSSPAGGTPTGSVVFKNGTTTLGTKKLSGGIAIYLTAALPLGSNSITAAYGGSSNYSGSTSAPLIQVVLTATTITLSSSPNPSSYGQAVTFTATVTSSLGAPPPDGETVSFMKGTTVLGTGTLIGGLASFTTSTLPAGTNAVQAVYGGDANLTASTSKAVSQVVNKATTTTTLVSSLNPSIVGQSATFTASVAPQFSGTVKGTVTFYDGTTALKTVGLSGGVAKFTTSTLASGTHTITATYNGSTSFTGSSVSLTQTVISKATTTTTLVSSLNPSTYGLAVTWTATVTSTGPITPTGTVKFGTIGGYGKLSGGVATFSKTWLNAATYAITAEYEGDSGSAPSTSSVLEQVVNPTPTTTVITSSANPSSSGQTVTFTATVTSSTGAHATGTVTFTAGATTLGTVALSGIHASISTATLPVGSTTVTATYNGATDYTGSSGSLIQTVN